MKGENWRIMEGYTQHHRHALTHTYTKMSISGFGSLPQLVKAYHLSWSCRYSVSQHGSCTLSILKECLSLRISDRSSVGGLALGSCMPCIQEKHDVSVWDKCKYSATICGYRVNVWRECCGKRWPWGVTGQEGLHLKPHQAVRFVSVMFYSCFVGLVFKLCIEVSFLEPLSKIG